jgi:hypothetical protein
MQEGTQVTPTEIEEQLQTLAPLAIIRTETVLSKLPIHNLAKKGSINIHIVQNNSKGKIELLWKVSPSRDYGEPRQLAYKLDTIVVNRHIDEARRPLAKLIRLGSLRELAQHLELGSDTAKVRKALLQNASVFITAKLTYKANDGRQRQLETGFTRYSVVFTGEQLPDGAKADAVYLILNEPYREVLNNAPVRPLDYDYLRKLPPAAQRFYEILSRKIFAAFKFKHPAATLTYSEYCTYSAQQRYFDRQPMQNQMNAIHREHKKFGYITDVSYAATTDADNKADWLISYTPGPKAKAEYLAFTRSGRAVENVMDVPTGNSARHTERIASIPRRSTRQRRLPFPAAAHEATLPVSEPPGLTEMTKRGISEARACELLAGTDNEFILDQLDWGDYLVANARGRIINPPGFYIHLIQERIAPPEAFETSRRRKARRELARDAHDRETSLRYEQDEAYHLFRSEAVDQYIREHIQPDDNAALIAAQVLRRRGSFKNLPEETIRQIAERDVRATIARDLNLPTFEAFCADRAAEKIAASSGSTL